MFVILTLWNGARMSDQNMIDLLNDMSKLESFLDNALAPLVRALALLPFFFKEIFILYTYSSVHEA